jgi:hypothetical protein
MGEVEPLQNHDYLDDGICPECMEKNMPGIHDIYKMYSEAWSAVVEVHQEAIAAEARAQEIEGMALYLRDKTWKRVN